MKTAFLILFTIFTISACIKKTESMPVNATIPPVRPDTPAANSLSYLALGDSYTCGQSVNQQNSFPFQLTTQLPGFTVSTPAVIATTGWTTDDLITAIDNCTIKNKTFDIVTLLIGVNDQYQGLSQANYRIKFAQVLKTAITFAGGKGSHVFVLSIPDYGVTPFAQGQESAIGPQIDQFNDINRAESDSADVNYVDITAISKLAASDAALVADDGLHPSAKMYQLWVAKLAPVVAGVLAGK